LPGESQKLRDCWRHGFRQRFALSHRLRAARAETSRQKPIQEKRTMTPVIDDIRAANRTFMDRLKRGDAAGIARLYTTDARLLPPGAAMMSGPNAIQTFWQGAMDMGVKEAVLQTLTVNDHDGVAYEVGTYVLGIQPAGGPRMNVAGKYVVVWQNQGGTWKLHVDIWNADAA
jgi:ketosteroid isomerase-like protein